MKLGPIRHIDSAHYRRIPGAHEPTHHGVGMMFDQLAKHMRSVVEVNVACNFLLGEGQMHFTRWDLVVCKPVHCFVDGPVGLR